MEMDMEQYQPLLNTAADVLEKGLEDTNVAYVMLLANSENNGIALAACTDMTPDTLLVVLECALKDGRLAKLGGQGGGTGAN